MKMSHYFSVLNTHWNFFDFQGLPFNFEIFPTFDILTTPLIGPGPTFYCFLIWKASHGSIWLIQYFVALHVYLELLNSHYSKKTTHYHNRAPSETFLEAEFCFFSGGQSF